MRVEESDGLTLLFSEYGRKEKDFREDFQMKERISR
jgi:hypothetical protein